MNCRMMKSLHRRARAPASYLVWYRCFALKVKFAKILLDEIKKEGQISPSFFYSLFLKLESVS